MQQNQRNGVEELTFVTFGFDRHDAYVPVHISRFKKQ